MKSKAHFKSHPLHPILVAFPISFFPGAFIFDILYLAFKAPALWQTGFYLCVAGIAGAAAAAIPGIIDYLHTVPPKSSAKKRATQHALINTTNLLLFVVIMIYRKDQPPGDMLVVFGEAVGVVLLSIAGWMGGTLVYRNQIGVDIRYAGAGKWKEEKLNDINAPLASVEEINLNQMKLVHVENKRIVVAKTEDGFVAFDDHCTHRGGSLAGGALMCGRVQCPWHGSQFNVFTGAVEAGPAHRPILTYPVEIREGNIYLKNI